MHCVAFLIDPEKVERTTGRGGGAQRGFWTLCASLSVSWSPLRIRLELQESSSLPSDRFEEQLACRPISLEEIQVGVASEAVFPR